MTDRELVLETLKDRHIFAVLIERYEASLTRYINRLGSRDPEVTKDILQEAFIKAYINLNDFDTSLSFSAWMYRIVHNETVNHFRKQKNRPQSLEREESLILFDRIIDEMDVEAEADALMRSLKIQEALSVLDERYRDVLILRFFEEKSYDEISDILQIPTGTVATYLSRAKAKLKALLNKTRLSDV